MRRRDRQGEKFSDERTDPLGEGQEKPDLLPAPEQR